MARLLAAGSFSQTIAEGLSQQKLVAQYIHRELREADEANLLDEEGYVVFSCDIFFVTNFISSYHSHSFIALDAFH